MKTRVLMVLLMLALMSTVTAAQTVAPAKEVRSFTERVGDNQPAPMTEVERQQLKESVANTFQQLNNRFLNGQILKLEKPQQQWNWLKPAASHRQCKRKHTKLVIFGDPFNSGPMSPMRR